MTSASSSQTKVLRLYQSPIGKKLLTGITGLGLALFVLVHMVANLTLFFSAASYNQFGHVVETLGPLTWTFELLLLGVVVFHAVLGIQIFIDKRKARANSYTAYQSANQALQTPSNPSDTSPSYQSLSSRSMIWTGGILATFIVWHLATFKFGTRYLVPGSEVRDLARLVFETFHNPLYTGSYVVVMLLLGFHLRHGLWSALQSIGLLNRTVRPLVFTVGTMLAVLIALGFIGLPVAIYAGWLGS